MRKMLAKLSTIGRIFIQEEKAAIKRMKEKLGKVASQEGAADKQQIIYDVKTNVQTTSASSPSFVDGLRKSIVNAGFYSGMYTLGWFTASMISNKTK